MHSKYDPEREAGTFAQECTGGFVVVGGVGGGFHVGALLERLEPGAFVLACEADTESLAFCTGIPAVRALSEKPNVCFCTVETVAEQILARYVPAFHGSFHCILHRTWEAQDKERAATLKKRIQGALTQVSADFSVQSHFGKAWQRNILLNMAQYAAPQRLPERLLTARERTAAVIAAGPTLDRSIHGLLRHREDYTVFCTDTAYGTLRAHGITPEAVVSVDAQQISTTHYLPCPSAAPGGSAETERSVFIFDVCACHGSAKLVKQRGQDVLFAAGAHPLAVLACRGTGIPSVESGSGTVTIAACDIARQLGAPRIRLFGADFSYNAGKAYARGTYLDGNFRSVQTRLCPAETRFCALLFRTECTPHPAPLTFSGQARDARTSPVLTGFEESLLAWARKHSYALEGGMLVHRPHGGTDPAPRWKPGTERPFEPGPFFAALEALPAAGAELHDILPLLPYVAWLRKNAFSPAKEPLFGLLKLAHTSASRYTRVYEK